MKKINTKMDSTMDYMDILEKYDAKWVLFFFFFYNYYFKQWNYKNHPQNWAISKHIWNTLEIKGISVQ